ncbi:MAG: hypothetical protein H0T73_03605 [Ardenticatenales bacterium]|nr:hypothetical protein [Ardenticatenales bacterium]
MEDGLRTMATSRLRRQVAIQKQLLSSQVDLTSKDPDTAFALEFLSGSFLLLGIGYLYSGLTNPGLIRLFGLWIFWAIGLSLVGMTGFVGCFCLIPPLVLAHFFFAYQSADDLKKGLVAARKTHH